MAMRISSIVISLLVLHKAFASKLCLPDCSSGECTFAFSVRFKAGELGYFTVKGCDGVNPTLGLEISKTHTFLQKSHHNYYHPLGFAYYPDGDHAEAQELNPSVPPPFSGSTCSNRRSCPTPRYFLNDEYLGTWSKRGDSISNDPNDLPSADEDETAEYNDLQGDSQDTENSDSLFRDEEADFGLDAYEPKFFHPFNQWLGYGTFSVKLRFDEAYDRDIFYFCHIHQFMSGRIKLLRNGKPLQTDSKLPEIPYDYDNPSTFDESCGTFGLSDYQLPNAQCPEKFVCNKKESTIGRFAACLEAMNCHMFMGMTTSVSARSVAALFLHQMIPHHENAVNMAKTLLMLGDLECQPFNEEDPDCVMYAMGISIVASQNFQIQKMQYLLKSYGFPEDDDCVVPVTSRGLGEEELFFGDPIAPFKLRSMTRANRLHHEEHIVSHENDLTGIRGEFHNTDETLEAKQVPMILQQTKVDNNSAIHERKAKATSDDDDETRLEETEDKICISSTGRYTARVDLNAGELGYFTFDECGDQVNPTIGMEIGKAYIFDQADRSNYFHPLGFAYHPDGDHADAKELEPGIKPRGTNSDCDTRLTCPAPMYFQDDKYLGVYSNNEEIDSPTLGKDNFGLDDYEPLFFRPLPEWSASKFSVSLKFDEQAFDSDIFYFCHIHELMTGRIKLLKNGVPVTRKNTPSLKYEYDSPGPFDKQCGTFGLDDYQLPNKECFDRFVCDVPDTDPNLKLYAQCIEAMNCHMLTGMTSMATSNSGVALFIHHMVPHHQNAVNMAKATLKFANLQCDDLTKETNDCLYETILREIINGQNFEIQAMYGVLKAKNFPKTDDCVVNIEHPKHRRTLDASSGEMLSSSWPIFLSFLFPLVYFVSH